MNQIEIVDVESDSENQIFLKKNLEDTTNLYNNNTSKISQEKNLNAVSTITNSKKSSNLTNQKCDVQLSLYFSCLKLSSTLQNKLKKTLSVKNVLFHKDVIVKVSQIVETLFQTKWSMDLKAFSKHAKRATITADDARLLFHRNALLMKKISDLTNNQKKTFFKENFDENNDKTNNISKTKEVLVEQKKIDKKQNLKNENNELKSSIVKKKTVDKKKEKDFLNTNLNDVRKNKNSTFSLIENSLNTKNLSSNFEIQSTISTQGSENLCNNNVLENDYTKMIVESSQSSSSIKNIIEPVIIDEEIKSITLENDINYKNLIEDSDLDCKIYIDEPTTIVNQKRLLRRSNENKVKKAKLSEFSESKQQNIKEPLLINNSSKNSNMLDSDKKSFGTIVRLLGEKKTENKCNKTKPCDENNSDKEETNSLYDDDLFNDDDF